MVIERRIKTVTHWEEKPPWMTKEDLKEFCCNEPNYDIACKKTVGPWTGYTGNDLELSLDKNGKNSAGEKVVIHWKSRKHPCGTLHTKYDEDPPDCCEGVLPVNFPFDHNPTVMSDNSSVELYIADGLPPFELFAESDNIHFLNSLGEEVKRIVTHNRFVTLYSDDICGTVEVVVFDECQGEATIGLRALQGQWVTVEFRDYKAWCYYDCGQGHSDFSCSYSGAEQKGYPPVSELTLDYEDWPAPPEGNFTRRGFQGPYRFTEISGQTSRVTLDPNKIFSCAEGCGTKTRTLTVGNPPWTPCLGKPSGWVLCDLTSPGIADCLLWNSGVRCGNCNCSDEWGYWKDRYGVVTCGTQTYTIGLGVDSRRWEEWRC